ncbi:DUF1599 domain-containing protein [Bacteroidota bacterium]
MPDTNKQYNEITRICGELFLTKMKDYGTAWRILRSSSVTDQIYIKAQRIKSIETKGVSKVEDSIKSEYIGIVNYCVIGLIQLDLGDSEENDLSIEKTEELYWLHVNTAKELMLNKNHDYDEAWRSMRMSSYTDLILMKIFRTKQIEDNLGKTLISEGISANYLDIINYAIFALIKIEFED